MFRSWKFKRLTHILVFQVVQVSIIQNSETHICFFRCFRCREFKIVNGAAVPVERQYTQEQVQEAFEGLLESKFPLPFVLVLIGYGFILLIDKVLIDSHDITT